MPLVIACERVELAAREASEPKYLEILFSPLLLPLSFASVEWPEREVSGAGAAAAVSTLWRLFMWVAMFVALLMYVIAARYILFYKFACVLSKFPFFFCKTRTVATHLTCGSMVVRWIFPHRHSCLSPFYLPIRIGWIMHIVSHSRSGSDSGFSPKKDES